MDPVKEVADTACDGLRKLVEAGKPLPQSLKELELLWEQTKRLVSGECGWGGEADVMVPELPTLPGGFALRVRSAACGCVRGQERGRCRDVVLHCYVALLCASTATAARCPESHLSCCRWQRSSSWRRARAISSTRR